MLSRAVCVLLFVCVCAALTYTECPGFVSVGSATPDATNCALLNGKTSASGLLYSGCFFNGTACLIAQSCSDFVATSDSEKNAMHCRDILSPTRCQYTAGSSSATGDTCTVPTACTQLYPFIDAESYDTRCITSSLGCVQSPTACGAASGCASFTPVPNSLGNQYECMGMTKTDVVGCVYTAGNTPSNDTCTQINTCEGYIPLSGETACNAIQTATGCWLNSASCVPITACSQIDSADTRCYSSNVLCYVSATSTCINAAAVNTAAVHDCSSFVPGANFAINQQRCVLLSKQASSTSGCVYSPGDVPTLDACTPGALCTDFINSGSATINAAQCGELTTTDPIGCVYTAGATAAKDTCLQATLCGQYASLAGTPTANGQQCYKIPQVCAYVGTTCSVASVCSDITAYNGGSPATATDARCYDFTATTTPFNYCGTSASATGLCDVIANSACTDWQAGASASLNKLRCAEMDGLVSGCTYSNGTTPQQDTCIASAQCSDFMASTTAVTNSARCAALSASITAGVGCIYKAGTTANKDTCISSTKCTDYALIATGLPNQHVQCEMLPQAATCIYTSTGTSTGTCAVATGCANILTVSDFRCYASSFLCESDGATPTPACQNVASTLLCSGWHAGVLSSINQQRCAAVAQPEGCVYTAGITNAEGDTCVKATSCAQFASTTTKGTNTARCTALSLLDSVGCVYKAGATAIQDTCTQITSCAQFAAKSVPFTQTQCETTPDNATCIYTSGATPTCTAATTCTTIPVVSDFRCKTSNLLCGTGTLAGSSCVTIATTTACSDWSAGSNQDINFQRCEGVASTIGCIYTKGTTAAGDTCADADACSRFMNTGSQTNNHARCTAISLAGPQNCKYTAGASAASDTCVAVTQCAGFVPTSSASINSAECLALYDIDVNPRGCVYTHGASAALDTCVAPAACADFVATLSASQNLVSCYSINVSHSCVYTASLSIATSDTCVEATACNDLTISGVSTYQQNACLGSSYGCELVGSTCYDKCNGHLYVKTNPLASCIAITAPNRCYLDNSTGTPACVEAAVCEDLGIVPTSGDTRCQYSALSCSHTALQLCTGLCNIPTDETSYSNCHSVGNCMFDPASSTRCNAITTCNSFNNYDLLTGCAASHETLTCIVNSTGSCVPDTDKCQIAFNRILYIANKANNANNISPDELNPCYGTSNGCTFNSATLSCRTVASCADFNTAGDFAGCILPHTGLSIYCKNESNVCTDATPSWSYTYGTCKSTCTKTAVGVCSYPDGRVPSDTTLCGAVVTSVSCHSVDECMPEIGYSLTSCNTSCMQTESCVFPDGTAATGCVNAELQTQQCHDVGECMPAWVAGAYGQCIENRQTIQVCMYPNASVAVTCDGDSTTQGCGNPTTKTYVITLAAFDYATHLAGIDPLSFTIVEDFNFNRTLIEGQISYVVAFGLHNDTLGIEDDATELFSTSALTFTTVLPGNGTLYVQLLVSMVPVAETSAKVYLSLPSPAQVNTQLNSLTNSTAPPPTADSANTIVNNIVNLLVGKSFASIVLDVGQKNNIIATISASATACAVIADLPATQLVMKVDSVATSQIAAYQAIVNSGQFNSTQIATIAVAASTTMLAFATKIISTSGNGLTMTIVSASTASNVYNLVKSADTSSAISSDQVQVLFTLLAMSASTSVKGASPIVFNMGTRGMMKNVFPGLTSGYVAGTTSRRDVTPTTVTLDTNAVTQYSFAFSGAGNAVTILAVVSTTATANGNSVTVFTTPMNSSYTVSCSVNVTGSNGLPSANATACVATYSANSITCSCQSYGTVQYLLTAASSGTSSSSSTFPPGAIAGIVIGVVVVVAVVVGFFILRNRKRHQKTKDNETN